VTLPVLLHIPDGFLSFPVSTAMFLLAGLFVGIAVRRSGADQDESTAPLLGVLAAFIFAGQMMNFPVAGGTSGHMLGGALAAILVGPWAAIVIMAAVVSVQALVFQDGGLASLGANIFNMGVTTVFVATAIVYLTLKVLGRERRSILIASFIAAWTSVMVSAGLASVELAVSGTSPWGVVLPAMLGVHTLIGIGEGLITMAAVGLVLSARPDLVRSVSTGTESREPAWEGSHSV
jgi:cobalt/nickel transport system permease protein